MSTVVSATPTPGVSQPVELEVSNVSQIRVLRSEWIKFWSLRSTWLTLLAAVVAMIAIGWLVGWATNSHWASAPPDERLGFEPIGRSLVGVNLAQLAVGVLGVLLISGEYATGMIRATLSAVPTRAPVLWAKAGLFALVTYVLMLATTLVAFIGGQHFLASHGTTLSAPFALHAVVGVAGYLTLVGVLAVALGFIIRSTAGGITALVGLLLVVPGIGQVLPLSWRNHTLPYLPSNAGASMYTLHPEDPAALSSSMGLLVLCLWVAAALALAYGLLKRRDA